MTRAQKKVKHDTFLAAAAIAQLNVDYWTRRNNVDKAEASKDIAIALRVQAYATGYGEEKSVSK